MVVRTLSLGAELGEGDATKQTSRENFKRVTQKGGLRCERFDRTLSVVLKSLSQGFYRTFLGPKRGFDRTLLGVR